MTRRCQKSLDFLTGLGVGLLVSTATALLLAELKYFIEQGHARRIRLFPSFDDLYGGDRMEITSAAMLDEMIARTKAESEGVHERRMFRERGAEHHGDTGGGTVYYNEE